MNADEATDIRSRIATDRQLRYRCDRDRLRSLCESDRQAEAQRQYAALIGTPAHIGAPEDFGAPGLASIARGLHREDADARSAGSASRRGVKVERMRVTCECILDSLYMRENGNMTEAQYLAGMRFPPVLVGQPSRVSRLRRLRAAPGWICLICAGERIPDRRTDRHRHSAGNAHLSTAPDHHCGVWRGPTRRPTRKGSVGWPDDTCR